MLALIGPGKLSLDELLVRRAFGADGA
jgi:hypothetical protein